MNLDPANLCNQVILDNLFEGLYLVDRERTITFFNRAAEIITGFSAAEMVGGHCFHNRLRHLNDQGEPACFKSCPLRRTIEEAKITNVDMFFLHKDGHRVPVQVRVVPLIGPGGAVTGAAEIFTYNQPRVPPGQEIERLKKLAMLDAVTNIGNRHYAQISLKSKLEDLVNFDLPFGLLFLDLDRFKLINDEHGHDVGDQVLRMVARTVTANLRSGDALHRWGGEEFVASIANVSTKDQLFSVANKIRLMVRNSALRRDNEPDISVKISIGATLAKKGDNIGDLVKRADELMYEVKKKGGDSVAVD